MFAKFFGYLNLSWRGGTKQRIIWGPEIIKIMEKSYCLADSYTKIAKHSHNYLQYKVFSSCWFLMGYFDYYFEDQKFKGHMKLCFRKVCLSIVWKIDDYQRKCSFSVFDIFGGSATKRLITMRPDLLINNLRTKTWGPKDQLKKYFVHCFSLFLLFLKVYEKENSKVKDHTNKTRFHQIK